MFKVSSVIDFKGIRLRNGKCMYAVNFNLHHLEEGPAEIWGSRITNAYPRGHG